MKKAADAGTGKPIKLKDCYSLEEYISTGMGQILMSRKESSVSREKQKTVKNNVSEQ
jgi:hypothetical protein